MTLCVLSFGLPLGVSSEGSLGDFDYLPKRLVELALDVGEFLFGLVLQGFLLIFGQTEINRNKKGSESNSSA
ncbi:MAG: hypothetical protein QG653_130 [Patescibacteria group bacterium]|nr:hypothetical protein [Patescibacteria group bacterium]